MGGDPSINRLGPAAGMRVILIHGLERRDVRQGAPREPPHIF